MCVSGYVVSLGSNSIDVEGAAAIGAGLHHVPSLTTLKYVRGALLWARYSWVWCKRVDWDLCGWCAVCHDVCDRSDLCDGAGHVDALCVYLWVGLFLFVVVVVVSVVVWRCCVRAMEAAHAGGCVVAC